MNAAAGHGSFAKAGRDQVGVDGRTVEGVRYSGLKGSEPRGNAHPQSDPAPSSVVSD